MSTLLTFGYIGGPSGDSRARAVQFQLLAHGTDTPDLAQIPAATLSGDPAWVPPGTSLTKPAANIPQSVALRENYWPAATPAGFFRDSEPPRVWPAGACIRISAAEAYALACVGALKL